MAERAPAYAVWVNALMLCGLGWAAILLELAPIGGRAGATPSPDLLFCVAGYLAIRRPSATPAILVLLLGLSRDLIGGGPAGLGALLLAGAVEVLRVQRDTILRRGFFFELALVAALTVGVAAVHVVALTVTFVPAPALDILARGAVVTLAAYAVTAATIRWFLRVRAEPEANRALIGRAAR